MNETLDWSWRGMNGNFNFGDCCDGYGGLHAAAVLLFSLHSLSTTGVQETFQLFLSICYVLFFLLHYDLPFSIEVFKLLFHSNWKTNTNLLRDIDQLLLLQIT